VVLGVGMGGIGLLRRVVTRLPANLNLALLAITRLPPDLLLPFAQRLARDCAFPVAVAREGDAMRPGVLLLAPAGTNLGMVRTGRVPRALVRLTPPEIGIAQIPSFDVTLRACATIYGPAAAGLILCGLSRDGVEGFQALRARGGLTGLLALTHAAVGNLNRACLEAEVVDEVLEPDGLVERITSLGRARA